MREHFLINPDIIFLNHGSFGATPKPVFEVYQQWQRDFEWQPIEFFGRRSDELMAIARQPLAQFIHAEPENLAYVVNATAAINLVAKSLPLQAGDEVLITDHEYGAVERTWSWSSERAGAKIVTHHTPMPLTNHADFVESFWESVTPRTKVIAISHITSPTALILPVAEICRRARAQGILTVIDGAHTVGQLPLDMQAIDADFYTSNCHKWLCAPKGAAFLYAHPALKERLEPLVLSWGYVNGNEFSNRHEMWGTRDISAFLSVPAAIDFYHQHHWDAVVRACQTIIQEAWGQFQAIEGVVPLAPNNGEWLGQLISVQLPDHVNVADLKLRLYDHYRIEIPVFEWQGRNILRLSVQGYNTRDEVAALMSALHTELQ